MDRICEDPSLKLHIHATENIISEDHVGQRCCRCLARGRLLVGVAVHRSLLMVVSIRLKLVGATVVVLAKREKRREGRLEREGEDVQATLPGRWWLVAACS